MTVGSVDARPVDGGYAGSIERRREVEHPSTLGRPTAYAHSPIARSGHTDAMTARNVLGGPLEECGLDPVTGFFRDGSCQTDDRDVGSHTICAVMTAEFLEHQRGIGNDLMSPMPVYRFPGLTPGDRWCVTARNWLQAHHDGAAAPVVLASTHERVLSIVPLAVLSTYAVDVPDTVAGLDD